MALLDDLVARYAGTNLEDIFREVDATENRSVDSVDRKSDQEVGKKSVVVAGKRRSIA